MALRAVGLVLLAVSVTANLPVNGWYDCNIYTEASTTSSSSPKSSYDLKASFGDDGRIWKALLQPVRTTYVEAALAPSQQSKSPPVECAVFTLPLCYPGLCSVSANITDTIPVFVKRVLATKRSSTTKALWFLQGGPGASSENMESLMVLVYKLLGGAVDMYTMDHRGTGRSNRLTCEASQIETSGSPTKGQITNSVLATCIQDVNAQLGYDNATVLRSYSTTSAAMDLSSLVTDLGNSNTFVYGVSYGTYLVERLMQLANPNIKGYVLDGIVSNSGSDTNEKLVFNDWDKNVDSVAQTFVSLCSADTFCSSKFPSTDLKTVMTNLYKTLDASPSKTQCSTILSSMLGRQRPSVTLRLVFSALLQDMSLRAFIPAIVYRVQRCSDADVLALYNFLIRFAASNSDDSNDMDSTMLYNLIVASELWRKPTESADELSTVFLNGLIGSDASDLVTTYCIASRGGDSNCASEPTSKYPLVYPTDKYFDVPITIPKGSSVLLMSGVLDPQTYFKYGRYQYASMTGANKQLIEFNYSAHGTIANTPVTTKNGAPCGSQIVASFVDVAGDLSSLDKACLQQVAPMSFQLAASDVKTMMATADAYDGTPTEKFTPSSTSAGSKGGSQAAGNVETTTTSSGWKTAAIIAFVLAGLLLIALGYMLYRDRVRAKREAKYEEHVPEA
ncbi:serine protease family S33 [Achlya hypogyna]|uniref:Serine protease family S33 n=1 Tax=Achlya hypogyna TaxID=1202772 RepID=A0A1V9YZ93_ACHHY|nr:serine protease family S33 [Achlya hypogyna]